MIAAPAQETTIPAAPVKTTVSSSVSVEFRGPGRAGEGVMPGLGRWWVHQVISAPEKMHAFGRGRDSMCRPALGVHTGSVLRQDQLTLSVYTRMVLA